MHFFCFFLGLHGLPVWEIESSHARYCLHALSISIYLYDLLFLRKHCEIDSRMEKMHVVKENSNHHRNFSSDSIRGLVNNANAPSSRITIMA